MYIIAIDPGISGSICFYEKGRITEILDMPTMTDGKKNKKQVNGSQIYNEILKRINKFQKKDIRVIVEQVSADSSLIQHQRILSSIISETQPLFLHLNGSHAIQVVEKLYCEHPLERQGELGSQFGLRFGEVVINETKIKVLAHNQFGYGRYNPSKKHWPEFARAWRNWINK